MLGISVLEDGTGLALTGALDLSTEDQARAALEAVAKPGAVLTLDLMGLEFMDSTGLNIIVRVLEAIGGEGSMEIRIRPGIVERILTVSGLSDRANLTVWSA